MEVFLQLGAEARITDPLQYLGPQLLRKWNPSRSRKSGSENHDPVSTRSHLAQTLVGLSCGDGAPERGSSPSPPPYLIHRSHALQRKEEERTVAVVTTRA